MLLLNIDYRTLKQLVQKNELMPIMKGNCQKRILWMHIANKIN